MTAASAERINHHDENVEDRVTVDVRYGGVAKRTLTVRRDSAAADVIRLTRGQWRVAAADPSVNHTPPASDDGASLYCCGGQRQIGSDETLAAAGVCSGDVLVIRRRRRHSDAVSELMDALERCGESSEVDDAASNFMSGWAYPPRAASGILVDALRRAMCAGRFDIDRLDALPEPLCSAVAKGAITIAVHAAERIASRDRGSGTAAALVDASAMLLWIARRRPKAMKMFGEHSAGADAVSAIRLFGDLFESVSHRQVRQIPDSPGTEELIEMACAMFVACNAAETAEETVVPYPAATITATELMQILGTTVDLPDALWMDTCCCRQCRAARRQSETAAETAEGRGGVQRDTRRRKRNEGDASGADFCTAVSRSPVIPSVAVTGAAAAAAAMGTDDDTHDDSDGDDDDDDDDSDSDGGDGDGSGSPYARIRRTRNAMTLSIVVDRNDVLTTSYRGIMGVADQLGDWASNSSTPAIEVRFSGEDGFGDGVMRDWLTMLNSQLFEPQAKVFAAAPGDGAGPVHHIAEFACPSWCWFAGVAMGLSARCGVCTCHHLSSAIIKAFRGRCSLIGLRDLQQLDPDVARICARALGAATKADLDALGLPGFVIGDRELLPGGEGVRVTMANRELFVYLLSTTVANVSPVGPRAHAPNDGVPPSGTDTVSLGPECARALRGGFLTTMGMETGPSAARLLLPMSARGFNTCIGGPLTVRGDHIVRHVYLTVDPGVDHERAAALAAAFRHHVEHGMAQPQLRNLLRFWTGSYALPAPRQGGAADSRYPRAHQPIGAGGSSSSSNSLLQLRLRPDEPAGTRPTSHTCFMQLCMPVTSDPLAAMARLDEAIANCDMIAD